MPGTLSKILASQVVDACGEEASEVCVRDASWGRLPVNEGRVVDLISKGGGATRLLLTIGGKSREKLKVAQEA